jgi:RHS repeat-associated protein
LARRIVATAPNPPYVLGAATITTPTPAEGKPTIESSLRFPGQVEDAETGLYYNWHRYYDPELGRYVTADPIGLVGGINLYAYVNGDPVNLADPEGEWIWFVVRGVVGLCERYPAKCAAVASAIVGAIMDVSFQLYENDGNWECVDLVEAGGAGVANAVGGAVIGKALKYGSKLKWFNKSKNNLKDRLQRFKNRAPKEPIGTAKVFPTSQIIKVGYSGKLNYVVKDTGELVVGRSGHVSLAGGGDVLAAGEANFVNGTLKSVNNASGHYAPSGASAQNAAESAFQKAGFDSFGKALD